MSLYNGLDVRFRLGLPEDVISDSVCALYVDGFSEMDAYKAARRELKERDVRAKEEEAKAPSKDDKKKKGSKKDKAPKAVEIPLGREAALIDDFSDLFQEVRSKIGEIEDTIEFQLKQMSDR